MTPQEFRSALASAGLRQRRLAELLGVAVSTVNRWANESPQHIPPPLYAINFVRAWAAMTPEQQATITTDSNVH